jgi:hypothetical protein
MVEVFEKNTLRFFIGRMKVEVKNLVKMFEPKSLKQDCTLAMLHGKGVIM